MRKWWWVAAAAALAGCEKRPSRDPAAAPPPPRAPPPVVVAAPPDARHAANQLADRAYDEMMRLRGAEWEGVMAHDVGVLLKRALAADPGNAMARYTLACLQWSFGHEAKAAGRLESLRSEACPECLDVLDNLGRDPTCEWHPGLAKLRPDVAPPLTEAADRVARALAAGEPSGLDGVLAPDGEVAVTITCGGCVHGPSAVTHTRLRGAAAVRAFIVQRGSGTHTGDARFCRDGCCELRRPLPTHQAALLDRLCFTGGTPQLLSIDLTDG